MSSNKQNVGAQANNIAGKTPGEVKAVPVPSRIHTQEQAEALIKAQYNIPANVPFVLVAEDKSVFYAANYGSGINHAVKHNLKSFKVTCQD